MPGQDAFGTIQEIVQILQSDPKTDWSKVNIDALRQHLIDMNEVTLHAAAAQRIMNKHEDIAKSLKIRLSELTSRVAEIDSELRKPLSADSEDRATDLENQDALEGIEISEIREIKQISEALRRIAEGTYGICSQCGGDIDPKR